MNLLRIGQTVAAQASSLIATARNSLPMINTQAALERIRFGTSWVAANPVRGVALLAAAVVTWTLGSRLISSCFRRAHRRQDTTPGSVSSPAIETVKTADTVLQAAAEKLSAIQLDHSAVQDARTFEFKLQDQGVAYTGVDARGCQFYAFQLFSKKNGKEQKSRIEILYRDLGGIWSVHSKKPIFFGENRGTIIPAALTFLEKTLMNGKIVDRAADQTLISLRPIPAEAKSKGNTKT